MQYLSLDICIARLDIKYVTRLLVLYNVLLYSTFIFERCREEGERYLPILNLEENCKAAQKCDRLIMFSSFKLKWRNLKTKLTKTSLRVNFIDSLFSSSFYTKFTPINQVGEYDKPRKHYKCIYY